MKYYSGNRDTILILIRFFSGIGIIPSILDFGSGIVSIKLVIINLVIFFVSWILVKVNKQLPYKPIHE